MTNFDTARDALETSLNSSGSAMKEHEKWQQSLEARILSLKASWQSLSQTFMQSDFLKLGIDGITGLVDGIDHLISKFGVLGTTVGGVGLYKAFKNGFAVDADGNKIGAYFNIFKGLGNDLKAAGSLINETITSGGKLGDKLRSIGQIGKKAGQDISKSFKESSGSLKAMATDILKVVAIMNAIKAVQDIVSWISEAGNEAETTAEKFDRISSELSDADSELRGLESELLSVESQIDTLLSKDELTFADEEELKRLQSISSELERQIELTKTLQKSLQQSLNTTALGAYTEYNKDTSFYSEQSKSERKEEAEAMGTSIGNVAGLIIGGLVAAGITVASGGTLTPVAIGVGSGIGSTVGSIGGGLIGGLASDANYAAELTVGEAIDNMRLERTKLKKALEDAKEAYADDPTDANRQAYEAASQALSDYNATLSEHINKLANYQNSVDYASLTDDQKKEYIKNNDDLLAYNIEMGVKGAKAAALDSIFSDELITQEAKELRAAVESAFNSGESFNFTNFDGKEFDAIRDRLADMGITITDVIGYFEELKEAQAEAANYETYDVVKNIATLQEGVTLLTDAFKEFNEEGVVTAETLVSLHELFGGLGDDWSDYVNAVTSGTSSIEEIREATEKLAEAHLNDIFANGGIKFNKYNDETGEYEYDSEQYLTYLSTINQLEHIGVQNAKEYVDALQQQKMVQEAVNKIRVDASERNTLAEKESLNKDETERLNELNNKLAKGTADYISSVEKEYGLNIIDSTLVQKQADLEEYQKRAKQYAKWLSQVEGFEDAFEGSKELQDRYQDLIGNSSIDSINATLGHLSAQYADPGVAAGDTLRDWFGAEDTIIDQMRMLEQKKKDILANQLNIDAEVEKRQKMFDEMVDIAKNAEIDLSDIDIDDFDVNDISEDSIFNQVYDKVVTGLEDADWDELADGLETEIESGFDNLGLDIDFGRYFDKIILDSLKSDLETLNTAMAEAISGSGLSTDSIIAIEEMFGDLNSYDSSKLFEHTANGVRLNTEEFRKLNDEFKSSNVDGVKDKLSALGDEYNKTREELSDLEYGTDEYNSKISKLEGLEKQIKMTEEYASSLEGLFSAYQNWQRAEASGSQRDMYEGMIGGFENMDDEISRGWLDDGTIEFLRLIKGENISATATTKELMEAYKSLDDTIEHTGYSIRDFFTVDEDGNSTNTGVYNFLDAIGQMEEEKFGGKDVVQRDKDKNIIGFDFKLAGGDQAIADALGISKELVQIMIRAADDAGFVISMDGTYQQLDILKEKASEAATKLKDTFGKTEHEFFKDGSKDGVLKDYQEALKVWEEYSKNKNADGTVNMDVKGAEEAFTLVSTLQSMVDKLSEPVYMELDASEVDKDMQTPLSKLQEYERLVKQENQLKLKGTDTSEIDKSQKEIIDYLDGLSPEIKADLGIKNDSWEEIQRKVEAGEIEIPATVDLQVEMNDTLRDMVNVALYNAGIIDKEELTKRVDIELYADNVDTSDVEEKTEDAVDGAVDGSTSREQNIKIVAETFGVKDVENLKNTMSGLTDEQVKAIAEAIGKGDVDALDNAIEGMDGTIVDAIANALGYDDVESLKTAINTMQGNEVSAAVNTDGQSAKIDTLQSSIWGLSGTTVDVVVNFIKSGWDAVKGWLTGGNKKKNNKGEEGGGSVDGTANVDGTTGKAFKQGSWGTKGSGTALVGELGRETLVRDGHYYTIGDNGAEFIKYRKGDIIFNHRQTEELFKNGRVISGGGRAKAFVDGTAFAGGSSGIGGIGKVSTKKKAKKKAAAKSKKVKTVAKTTTKDDTVTTTTTTTTSSSSNSNSSSSGSSGSGGTGKVEGNAVGTEKDEKEFKETFDFVAIAIDRIERAIDNLDRKASSTYRSWSERNTALVDEISKVGEEIDLQNSAYEKYMAKANSVGLEEEYAKQIREGSLSIKDFEGKGEKESEELENLTDKISEYQKWYELALDCEDAILELKETEAELYEQRFKNVQLEYEGILQGYEHTEAMLEEYINQAEAKGHIVSKEYYEALIANENSNIDILKQEQAALIAARDEAVANGISKTSQSYLDMCADIDAVTQEIEAAETATIEWANEIRNIDWEVFDLIQERISAVSDEADFLINLMSNDKLFDDKGKLTEQGMATMGLHGQKYNTYMYQADDYGAKVSELDAKIADDHYDQELINKRNEYLGLQREAILAAEDEKQAIKSLVEEGIELELDALQELIDKKNEELESEKDLYEYQKKVKEQTEEIASLEKQMAAYSGDNSEEARAKVQELKVSLEEAKTNLEETEYDKYISDTQQMLDTLYDEYELTLNARLDNLDFLVEGVIDSINDAATFAFGVDGTLTTALGADGAIATALGTNATTIKTTLENEAKSVGTTLSTAMSDVWNAEGSGNKVITMYGQGFQQQQTTTNTVLNSIKASIDRMVDDIDKDATTKVNSNKTATSAKKNPTTTSTTKKTTTTKKKSPSGDGKPKIGDRVKYVSGQYYYDSQGKKPLGSHKKGEYVYITNINTRDWATHGYHISTGKKLGSGDLGWLKLNQLSGYATGKKNFLDNEIAWTQENGKEFIVRPSDGAILTPIAKGDSVLTSAASSNIWDMANSPAEFIKDNLNLGVANAPNNSTVNNSYSQHIDNVVFRMDNVKNYEQLLAEMQKDKNFERLIMSMTIDQIAGKSSLGKNKSIR